MFFFTHLPPGEGQFNRLFCNRSKSQAMGWEKLPCEYQAIHGLLSCTLYSHACQKWRTLTLGVVSYPCVCGGTHIKRMRRLNSQLVQKWQHAKDDKRSGSFFHITFLKHQLCERLFPPKAIFYFHPRSFSGFFFFFCP